MDLAPRMLRDGLSVHDSFKEGILEAIDQVAVFHADGHVIGIKCRAFQLALTNRRRGDFLIRKNEPVFRGRR